MRSCGRRTVTLLRYTRPGTLRFCMACLCSLGNIIESTLRNADANENTNLIFHKGLIYVKVRE